MHIIENADSLWKNLWQLLSTEVNFEGWVRSKNFYMQTDIICFANDLCFKFTLQLLAVFNGLSITRCNDKFSAHFVEA